jgi:2-polyprenyl-6-methoxyphenol hydroxylase-like FAD-dependent oxidoreductase
MHSVCCAKLVRSPYRRRRTTPSLMYDVIVVGARCAGAPTALLLARRGYRVLLVDRSEFPSDTLSTHWIGYEGLARLQRWGLLDRVAASGCPPTQRRVIERSGLRIAGTIPPRDGLPGGYAPRRTVLDLLLVDAAIGAGAEFRSRFAVRELVCDAGQVVGVVGSSNGGQPVAERARLIVGADGHNSRVARAVNAPAYNISPPATCCYYTYWADTEVDGLYSWNSPKARRYQLAIPTNDGLVCTLIGWPHSDFPAIRANVEREFLAALELAPGIAQRVRCGRRVERFYGTADLPNHFRRPYGSGWALVGDAGHPKDPMAARGIRDAFRDVELLVEAVDAGFSGRTTFTDAMARYEQARNAAALPIYQRLCADVRFPPLPDPEVRLLTTLGEDQALANLYVGMRTGTVTRAEFQAAAPSAINALLKDIP